MDAIPMDEKERKAIPRTQGGPKEDQGTWWVVTTLNGGQDK